MKDALAASLGVPDDATLADANAFLGRLHARKLMRARHLLDAVVENDEVADQIEEPGLLAHLGEGPVHQCTGGERGSVGRFPLYKKLLPRGHRAVAQSLGITARENELHGGKETFVENLLLVGDELPHTIGDFDRAALQLDHADRDAVQVKDEIWPPFVAAAQGHFLGEGEVVVLRVRPIHQMHLLVRLSDGDLHRDSVAQQLVGAQVGLIKGDAGSVGGGHQLLKGSGNVRLGVSALLKVCPQQILLDAAVVLPLVPLAKVAVAQAIGPGRVREQRDNAVLRFALGSGDFRHCAMS